MSSKAKLVRLQSRTPAFDDFIWAFWDWRHEDCLAVARDILFGFLLLGAVGTPPLRTRDYIRRMIAIIKHDTHESKDKWIGHPSIPPRVFGPEQYLVTPPIQRT